MNRAEAFACVIVVAFAGLCILVLNYLNVHLAAAWWWPF